MSTVAPERRSAFSPFRHRIFFVIWLGMLVSMMGTWSQTVGAQWLFVNDPRAATIVPLVQTASTLPMMLLALPAGVLADAFDRRRMLIAVQVYVIVIAILLAVLTFMGMMPPALLLAFTFLTGAGGAMASPTWQALITELVPRDEIAGATRLDQVQVNVSRAAGPALAGLAIAAWGVPVVFAINAVATSLFVVALIVAARRWKPAVVTERVRERFLPAIGTGFRYVRHEPAIRTILIRFAIFMAFACTIWALLPLVASHHLDQGASGYGLLFGSIGVGAVLGAFGSGTLRKKLNSGGVLVVSGLAFAGALAGVALTHSVWVAIPLLVICGFGWTATVTTVVADLQVILPGWVRARVLAIYLMVFLGTQALASPVWGQVVARWGIKTALLVAAAGLVLSVVVVVLWKAQSPEDVDRTPQAYWGTTSFDEPDPMAGPVVVSVECFVEEENLAGWLEAMQEMRRSRMRSGATRWALYQVGESPGVYVEQFEVATWAEHAKQHDGRLTAEDQAIEQRAFSFITGPTRTNHLIGMPMVVPERRGSER
ncbi:MFS transporter [Aestuariimicrobium ganziense]|uniref:MFS transporter n=1 Tax=Aestuariimicrobium ganziense TaxID=2773677 RepID=UPI0019459342|nr:MFS transporter [Aestuariimicrobium ganziense]